jgi:acetyl esterase/lipase
MIMLLATGAAAQDKKAGKRDAGMKYPPELPGAKIIEYKTVGTEVHLNLYLYEPEGHTPADKSPAIVFFFGGGWANGSPSQFQHHCRYLASRGMVAITADYRVSTRHHTTVADAVRDANSAMRYVRQHAGELGIDPDRIASGGGSAGGHLAACTGTLPEFIEPQEDGSISSLANAMVLFNPVCLLTPESGSTKSDEGLKSIASRFGAPGEALSPALHIKKDTAPTIMFFGSDDSLIAGAKIMRDKMNAASLRCELNTYEGQRHGFFNFGRTEGNRYFLETVKAMDHFLVSLGYLRGPDTVDTFDWNVAP